MVYSDWLKILETCMLYWLIRLYGFVHYRSVLPWSQQSGYQIPTKMPNLFDDSLNASGVKRKLLLTVQSCANKLPGVIHLPIKTKPHITELLLMKTVMTLKNYGKFCVLPYTVSLTRFFHQIVHKKNWLNSLPLFLPIRLLKSESLFPVLHLFPSLSPLNLPGLVKFDDASRDDIAKVIKNSPTKSCLLDPWPTFLVKDCLDILLPSITKLVNCSLLEGAVPDGFKSAVVTPLIKKSSLSKDELKNYRPVSGLSFISKLVERVVASQLSRHVSLHGLENEYQSAYRRGHSTETALLSIKNQIHLSLARGEATAVVLLDQSAAFDTIDHDKLLDCLRKWFSVGGRCLDWFKSYLSDRTQCIKIGSVLSEARKLKFGVPQGSVLGPIFFSLYTTPLSKVISKHPDVKFHFYADDTQLFIHLKHKNAKIAFDRLGKCLEDVKLWLCANKLKLNADKTDFIIFGTKSQQEKFNPFFPVNILGESLIPSDAVKNLGVWFDSDFFFTKHVKNVCKLCFIQMRDLRQIRQYLTRDAALTAANALVGSGLDYCNSLFRGLSVANLRKLQCIQNSLARIVCRTT